MICRLQDLSGYGIFLAGVKEFVAAFPDSAFQSPLVQLMVENGREGTEDMFYFPLENIARIQIKGNQTLKTFKVIWLPK